MIVHKIKRIRMVCCVEEEKIDKFFNEILEGLENEGSVEMLSEEIFYSESIHSLFIYFSFKFVFNSSI